MALRSLNTVTAVGRGSASSSARAAGGAVVLGETTGQDADLGVEAVPLHGVAVAAAAFGGARGAAAVDVRDAAVAEPDEVVDGLAAGRRRRRCERRRRRGAARRGRRPRPACRSASSARYGGRALRAEQDQCLAAVLQQAGHGAAARRGRR